VGIYNKNKKNKAVPLEENTYKNNKSSNLYNAVGNSIIPASNIL